MKIVETMANNLLNIALKEESVPGTKYSDVPAKGTYNDWKQSTFGWEATKHNWEKKSSPMIQAFDEAYQASGNPYIRIKPVTYNEHGFPKGERATFTPGTPTTPDTLNIPGGYWSRDDSHRWVDRPETRAVLAELSHAYQFNQPDLQNKSLDETWGTAPSYNESYVDSPLGESYDQWGVETPLSLLTTMLGYSDYARNFRRTEDMKRYDTPGTVEYQAHQEIEPYLFEKIYGQPPRNRSQNRGY